MERMHRPALKTILGASPAPSGSETFDITLDRGVAVRVNVEIQVAIANSSTAVNIAAADEAAIKAAIRASLTRQSGDPVVADVEMAAWEEALVIHEGELPETIVGRSATGSTTTLHPFRFAWSFRDKAWGPEEQAAYFEPCRHLHQVQVNVTSRPTLATSGLTVAGMTAEVVFEYDDDLPVCGAFRSMGALTITSDTIEVGSPSRELLDVWVKGNVEALGSTPASFQVTSKLGNIGLYNNMSPRFLRDIMGGQRGPWGSWLDLSLILTPLYLQTQGYELGNLKTGKLSATTGGGGTLSPFPVRYTQITPRDPAPILGLSHQQIIVASIIAKRLQRADIDVDSVKSTGVKALESGAPVGNSPKFYSRPLWFPTYKVGDEAEQRNKIGKLARARLGGREK